MVVWVEKQSWRERGGNMEKFTVHLTVKEKGMWHTANSVGGLLQKIEREVGEARVQHTTPILNWENEENLEKEEIIVHIDFGENYLCKYTSEIQAVHFGDSHKQIPSTPVMDIPQMIQFHFARWALLCGMLSGPISQKHWPTSLSSAHRLLLYTLWVMGLQPSIGLKCLTMVVVQNVCNKILFSYVFFYIDVISTTPCHLSLHILPLQIYHSSVLLAILYLLCHHGLFFAFTSLPTSFAHIVYRLVYTVLLTVCLYYSVSL